MFTNSKFNQRTGQPGETEEEVVQDSNHSDHSLHLLGNEEETTEEAPNTENEVGTGDATKYIEHSKHRHRVEKKEDYIAKQQCQR